ncbi:hypothetical protein NT6N_13020 [Oceaniferula spumae]|uniref:Uncharacterized protein n=1 Tax=Oceaniferula spumae TaxID=2979115 RepID=A0AAT9FK05_9BACT
MPCNPLATGEFTRNSTERFLAYGLQPIDWDGLIVHSKLQEHP